MHALEMEIEIEKQHTYRSLTSFPPLSSLVFRLTALKITRKKVWKESIRVVAAMGTRTANLGSQPVINGTLVVSFHASGPKRHTLSIIDICKICNAKDWSWRRTKKSSAQHPN